MSKYLKNLHKPCDKLDKYDNEPYMKNPLLKLNLAEIRKYRRQTKLEDSAVKVSIFTPAEPINREFPFSEQA